MALVVLGAKAVIAVLLLAAGGAKLADLPGFAAAIRLFAPRLATRPVLPAAALGVALSEIAVGAASLSSPRLGWLNPVVLAACCGFVAVWAAGYAWQAGPCKCFGTLSRRTFSAAGIGRAMVLAAAAALATMPVRPSLIQVSQAGRLALLAGALLVAGAAWTAAAAVGAGRVAVPGRA